MKNVMALKKQLDNLNNMRKKVIASSTQKKIIKKKTGGY